MSNDNDVVLARLWKLWAMVCKMIMDGKRDAKMVADYLQRIVDNTMRPPMAMVLRIVTVDRTRSPTQTLKATGCGRKYVVKGAFTAMPRGEGEVVGVIFFRLDTHRIDLSELAKAYALRGLKPADPYTLAAVNEADQSFSAIHKNTTYWQDSEGVTWMMSFGCIGPKRYVLVTQSASFNDGFLDEYEWFAGVQIDQR